MILRATVCIILLTSCIFSISLSAQKIQWASKVLDTDIKPLDYEYYSSELILGEPNIYPYHGLDGGCWVPLKENKECYIKVGFVEPQMVKQIIIAETYNPGAISKVFLYDTLGQEYLVSELEPKPTTRLTRLLKLNIEPTDYLVSACKIVMNGKKVDGYNAIDAVGIANTNKPLAVRPNVADFVFKEVKPKKMGPNINSDYPEINPILAPNGTTLYFGRKNHPENIGGTDDPEDIWYSEYNRANDSWSLAENIGKPLNNEGPNFVCSITPDGNAMTFLLGNEYSSGDKMKPGLSLATKSSEGWSEPEKLEIPWLKSESKIAHYFMANNRKVLLVSLETPESIGRNDLFVSFLNEETQQWSEPVNLGRDINTPGQDCCPYLAADNKTLYYSTDGKTGFGQQDIYITRRIDDSWTNWTEPENLGSNINSIFDDEFFSMPISGDFAYYSRGDDKGNLDVYRLSMDAFHKPEPVVLLKGMVFDKDSGEPIPHAKIVYERLSDGMEMGVSTSDDRGVYQIVIPYGEVYGYLAEAKDHLSLHENIDLTKLNEYKEIEKDLFLASAETGQKLQFNNIFFAFDKAELKKESFPELNRLAEFLKKNEKFDIQIEGHTDSIGVAAYNKYLSQQRAKSVKEFLVEKGVTNTRIKTVGYGEDKPLNDNSTAEDRRKNRRVEFELKKDE